MRRRLARLFSAPLRHLCRAALRAVITGLIFAVCLAAVLAYSGLPVPAPSELLDKFEGVSQLAEILS